MDAPPTRLDVLVVEADAGVAELLLAALGRAGLRASVCADPLAVPARLRATPTRVLLVERAPPGLDAAALLAELEAARLALPVLVTAAWLPAEDRRALCDAPGVAGVVEKPFELERLLADVRAACALASRADDAAGEAGVAGARAVGAGRPAASARCAAARAWFPGASRGVRPAGEAAAC